MTVYYTFDKNLNERTSGVDFMLIEEDPYHPGDKFSRARVVSDYLNTHLLLEEEKLWPQKFNVFDIKENLIDEFCATLVSQKEKSVTVLIFSKEEAGI